MGLRKSRKAQRDALPIDTSEYERAHGRKPGGFGYWTFFFVREVLYALVSSLAIASSCGPPAAAALRSVRRSAVPTIRLPTGSIAALDVARGRRSLYSPKGWVPTVEALGPVPALLWGKPSQRFPKRPAVADASMTFCRGSS